MGFPEQQWAERGNGLCAVELTQSGEFIEWAGLAPLREATLGGVYSIDRSATHERGRHPEKQKTPDQQGF
ncbi:hypothetical protein [Streptomyces bauhiniae]|uniref:hypothetical protein n=1 Tax=Streptomyces bauhiniae TaxID=2340725 RepID=UPI0035DCDF31